MSTHALHAAIRPVVESLEGRVLMSTVPVLNLDDAGPGSLRDAVSTAKRSAGPSRRAVSSSD